VKQIRGQIPANTELEGRFRSSAKAIAAELTPAQALQLLLLGDDATLIYAIETASDDGKIDSPPTERREILASRFPLYLGMYSVRAQFGPAGVRLQPTEWAPSVAMQLKRLINDVYADKEGQADLEWKLRGIAGDDTSDRLDVYLASTSPTDAVREFVFESRSRLEKSFRHLRFGRFELPTSPAEELHLRSRILWKLGADPLQFPGHLETFWTRLDALRQTAQALTSPYSDADREALRGPGTNFFVSLEEILDLSISFATWALLNDHWGDERRLRFVYERDAARRFTAETLSGRPMTADEELVFDPAGRNNLFPLVRSFRVLATLCSELRATDPTRYQRPRADWPHFAAPTGLELFPFTSKHPLLNLRPSAADSIIRSFLGVDQELDRSGVLDVRNRIPHNREPFPTGEEVETTCKAVAGIVENLEESGICPSVFLNDFEAEDRFGRRKRRSVDYRRRHFELLEPSPVRMCDIPGEDTPQVIFHAALLPECSDVLRFAYQEKSDYRNYWRDFPVPRRIPGTGDETMVAETDTQR